MTDGQAAFTTAFADFGRNELVPGLAAFYSGVDDYSLSVPNSLLIGTVEALTNESITGATTWGFGTPPTDFADALSAAQDSISVGESYFSDAVTAFAGGDYGSALTYDLVGSDLVSIFPLEELLLGAAASF